MFLGWYLVMLLVPVPQPLLHQTKFTSVWTRLCWIKASAGKYIESLMLANELLGLDLNC